MDSPRFEIVRAIALALPGVEEATKYDGSPVFRVDGVFLAGLALHPSAEPDTLVLRCPLDQRAPFLAEAPETYYLTPHFEPHPVVLVRLAKIEPDALADLLSVSYQLALPKTRSLRKNQNPRH